MKKAIKIGIICLGLLIVSFIIVSIVKNSKQADDVKEVAQKLDCEFIKMVTSDESGFEKDIYLNIPYLPVDSSKGENNQYYYEKLITATNSKMNHSNFRIIDEKKQLVIRVRYDGEKSSYTINGDNNYYQTEKAKLLKKESNKNIDLKVKSSELNSIIENEWVRTTTKKKLGTVDSSCNNYDYYFDEGYRIKTVNLNIYNVIFTTKYDGDVFEGIKTGMDNIQIKNILGSPTYENEDANFLIGYRTEKYYVFFCEGEISIYKIEMFNEQKNNEFASIITDFSQNGDYSVLLQRVTEIYPDYVQYERNNENIKLMYPHRGFSIEYNKNKKGITIYKNYEGKITNDISINNIGEKKLPRVIYIEGEDFILKTELERASNEYIIRNNNEENNLIKNTSKLYSIRKDNSIYRFYSKDKQNCDSEFEDENITTIINLDDERFLIGKNNDGIYEYNASTRELNKLLDVDGECKLVTIENNKLYYNTTYIDL